MIHKLKITPFGGLTVTQRYPSIIVQQVVMSGGSGGSGFPTDLANVRIKTDVNGDKFLQVIDPNTNLYGSLMVTAGQVVIGPGEA